LNCVEFGFDRFKALGSVGVNFCSSGSRIYLLGGGRFYAGADCPAGKRAGEKCPEIMSVYWSKWWYPLQFLLRCEMVLMQQQKREHASSHATAAA
jgi:hypothetical protein